MKPATCHKLGCQQHLQQDVLAGSLVGYILVHALVFTCSLTKLVDTDNVTPTPTEQKVK